MRTSPIINYLIIALVLFVAGCFSVKPGSVKSGKNLFETFYVGEEGTQYFIKPLEFRNAQNESFIMDITFRYKDELKGSAVLNFSVVNNELLKNIDNIEIISADNRIARNSPKHIYSEKNKEFFTSRFTSTFLLKDVVSLFKQSEWIITVRAEGSNFRYAPTKETAKAISKLDSEVFVLFSE